MTGCSMTKITSYPLLLVLFSFTRAKRYHYYPDYNNPFLELSKDVLYAILNCSKEAYSTINKTTKPIRSTVWTTLKDPDFYRKFLFTLVILAIVSIAIAVPPVQAKQHDSRVTAAQQSGPVPIHMASETGVMPTNDELNCMGEVCTRKSKMSMSENHEPLSRKDYIKEVLAAELTPQILRNKILVEDKFTRRKVISALTTMRSERGINEPYIDFVLKHPGLTFVVEKLDDSTEAAFYSTLNQIKISPNLLQSSQARLIQKLYHELWHAYQTYLSGNYADPRSFPFETIKHLTHPYSNQEPNSKEKFAAILDRGKQNLLKQSKEKKSRSAFSDYQPKVFFLHISLEQFESIREKVESSRVLNLLTPIHFMKGGNEINLFIKDFSFENGQVALTCHSVQDLNDKPNAFFGDILISIHTHHPDDQKSNPYYDDLAELDAVLQEFDQKYVDLIFNKRRSHHQKRLEDMWERVSNMPYPNSKAQIS